ncbi:MAG TPA: hypothetical protein VM901_02350 [Bdellovibrionota bacterium]|jgi:hypothetical protein|nr:hypothetical protein [Bdellovibrionota bacterium]
MSRPNTPKRVLSFLYVALCLAALAAALIQSQSRPVQHEEIDTQPVVLKARKALRTNS